MLIHEWYLPGKSVLYFPSGHRLESSQARLSNERVLSPWTLRCIAKSDMLWRLSSRSKVRACGAKQERFCRPFSQRPLREGLFRYLRMRRRFYGSRPSMISFFSFCFCFGSSFTLPYFSVAACFVVFGEPFEAFRLLSFSFPDGPVCVGATARRRSFSFLH